MPRAFSSGRRSVSTPGQGSDKGRLAVVDVAGGRDNHGALCTQREVPQLGDKLVFIRKAAQIQDQFPLADAANHRRRQSAKSRGQRVGRAAPALPARRQGDSGAGYSVYRECALPIWLMQSTIRVVAMPAAAFAIMGKMQSPESESRPAIGSACARWVRPAKAFPGWHTGAELPRARRAESCRCAVRASSGSF